MRRYLGRCCVLPGGAARRAKAGKRGGRDRTRRRVVLRADLRIHGGIELEESVVALLDAVRPEGGVGLAEGVALGVATETGGTQSELWDACGRVGRSPTHMMGRARGHATYPTRRATRRELSAAERYE